MAGCRCVIRCRLLLFFAAAHQMAVEEVRRVSVMVDVVKSTSTITVCGRLKFLSCCRMFVLCCVFLVMQPRRRK